MRPGGGPSLPAEAVSAAAQLGSSPARHLYHGRDPRRASSIEDLRAMAHRRLPRFVLEYLEGGAEEEGALAGNRAAFHRWHFLSHALAGAAEPDLSIPLFGTDLPLPLIVAPSGLNGLFCHRADILLAEAAAKVGIPFTQSTMSNETIEAVARVPGLRHWFQLYIMKEEAITHALVDRADRAGCEALVITTDAQIFGKRSWSKRERTDPTSLTLAAKWNAALHPGWLARTLLPAGLPRFPNFQDWLPDDRRSLFRSAFWIRDHMDKGADWESVARIRDRWKKPLLIKGLLRPEDVDKAAAIGADAAVLSNHGGRQLDWAAAPLDVLPAAREVAVGRIALLMDGGIRTGGDVLKAMALGADAVLVGRAPLYGLAGAGRAGALRAIEILADEMERDLALLSCRSPSELDGSFLMEERGAI
ncbi:alpha-hydroxy acid oxidase [Pedomonas mirosovicensis]|uniref:alpha-hydroxy acid oxidase n=1 Tax=Pedomonas mirosovicensis TaxID=2908641 RepID=UPI00216A9336|nr:alpha-hydroxy acid oxidase [Pedomonas mirosovicensis]MCH8686719.1 alpha-hydroxy-acid oxidizing protein [Pedomonas mirosovicensis]